MNLTRFSETDFAIARAFIDAVDANGRLTQNPEEILEALRLPEIEIEEVLAVLHRLQHFEPAGVFAADLRECLLLQLRQMDADTPHRNTAGAIVNRHLDSVATADPRQLSRRLRTTPEDILGALQLIRSLDPTPGLSVGDDTTEYIVPDVFVKRQQRPLAGRAEPRHCAKTAHQFPVRGPGEKGRIGQRQKLRTG